MRIYSAVEALVGLRARRDMSVQPGCAGFRRNRAKGSIMLLWRHLQPYKSFTARGRLPASSPPLLTHVLICVVTSHCFGEKSVTHPSSQSQRQRGHDPPPWHRTKRTASSSSSAPGRASACMSHRPLRLAASTASPSSRAIRRSSTATAPPSRRPPRPERASRSAHTRPTSLIMWPSTTS